MILRRFISFFGFSSEVVTAISWRISVAIFSRSSSVRIRRIASAPISAVNESSPYSSCARRYSSSERSWRSFRGVSPGSMTT